MMKRTVNITLILAVFFGGLVLSGCPLVYPGGGNVNFIGENNTPPGTDVGEVKVALSPDGGGDSLSGMGTFSSATGRFFLSLPGVASSNYSMGITVYDSGGNEMAHGGDQIWLAEGEQKTVNFTLELVDATLRVVIGAVTGGGNSNVYLDRAGAGMIWRWDYDGTSFEQFAQIAGWGNFLDISSIVVGFPDGLEISLTQSRALGEAVIQVDDSFSFVGARRREYREPGLYSLEIFDDAGGSVGRELLLNPTWAESGGNTARIINLWPDMPAMGDLEVNWSIADPTDVGSVVILVADRDNGRSLQNYLYVPDPFIPGIMNFSGFMTGISYNVIILTTDTVLPVTFIDQLGEVNPDSIAVELLLSEGAPRQVGVHTRDIMF